MDIDARTLHILHTIAEGEDRAGHVLLTTEQAEFALSPEGVRWLEVIDGPRRLFKLTAEAQQRIAV